MINSAIEEDDGDDEEEEEEAIYHERREERIATRRFVFHFGQVKKKTKAILNFIISCPDMNR